MVSKNETTVACCSVHYSVLVLYTFKSREKERTDCSNACVKTGLICWCICFLCVCVTVYQIVTDRIVQPPWAEPPTSFLPCLLDVLKLMWISRFHSSGCQLPALYPNSFLLSIDSSTMCQINWLPAQMAVKWIPWHFEFSSVISLCQPLVTS